MRCRFYAPDMYSHPFHIACEAGSKDSQLYIFRGLLTPSEVYAVHLYDYRKNRWYRVITSPNPDNNSYDVFRVKRGRRGGTVPTASRPMTQEDLAEMRRGLGRIMGIRSVSREKLPAWFRPLWKQALALANATLPRLRSEEWIPTPPSYGNDAAEQLTTAVEKKRNRIRTWSVESQTEGLSLGRY